MKYIDLTHTFKENMPVFPGDPIPEIKKAASINKHGFRDSQIKTSMHVGTHMDAPWHMLKNGKKLSDYPPEYFFGPGHILEVRGKSLNADLLAGKKISRGDIVFFLTGLANKFGRLEYYEAYPEISQACAKKIIELGVKIIGLDTPSPDRPPYVIHKMFFKNEILIIENLTNLESLLKYKRFTIAALPVKFETEAAPVRVIAQIL